MECISKQAWSVAIKHKWRRAQPILFLEGEAITLALFWFLRKTENHNEIVLLFTDNQTVMGA